MPDRTHRSLQDNVRTDSLEQGLFHQSGVLGRAGWGDFGGLKVLSGLGSGIRRLFD